AVDLHALLAEGPPDSRDVARVSLEQAPQLGLRGPARARLEVARGVPGVGAAWCRGAHAVGVEARLDGLREVPQLERAPGGQGQRELQGALELAHVVGKGVVREGEHEGEGEDRVAAARALEEVSR